MKALIVDEPWVSLILRGEKMWEMRSNHTQVRGRIALIRKGSGAVVGLADLLDSIGPLDEIAWRAHRGRHKIPLEGYPAVKRWNVAWELGDVRAFASPIAYTHPKGAVIWVNLSEEETKQVLATPERPGFFRRENAELPLAPVTTGLRQSPYVGPAAAQGELVPVAKDGSWFGPHLRRSSGYMIGAKGEEIVVGDYEQALEQLLLMTVPRWRRPNPTGNWGIVSGIEWKPADQMDR